ncbi:MAG: hypothetical protein LKJ88_07150 [Bacilli bacterium]|jgi:hypothetical protein|nr:hypothetical protein [Bacilli bacterium]
MEVIHIDYPYKRKKNLWINLVLIIVVLSLYSLNSFFIKPSLPEEKNFFEYVMENHFNDFLCPILICALLNVTALGVKKQLVVFWLIYLLLFIFSSFMWEYVRPYILQVFNPLHKTPHFLWGDILAYFLGYLSYYVFYICLYDKRKNLKETGK